MKIMYCIRGLFNSGGMERILIEKINYSNNFNKNFIKIITIYIQKQKEHKEKMESLIKELKPDILISLGDDERSFIYKFKYKKIKIIREHLFQKKYLVLRIKK